MQSRITDKGQRYGVCVLRKRRADLAGEIGALVLQLRHRRADMAKVDDLLRLLAPTSDPTKIIPTKQIRYLNIFKQGELGRLLIALLRTEGRPMTNIEMSNIILSRGGYAAELWTPIRRRTRGNLAYLENLGRVERIGFGRSAKWRILAGFSSQGAAPEKTISKDSN